MRPRRQRRRRNPRVILGPPPYILDVLRDPSLMRERQKQLGIAPEQLEIAAWCHEFHLQLERLAEARGITLLLMGGQGASLRLAPAAQRSSADNDYLTILTAAEVDALVGELLELLAPYAPTADIFRGQPIAPPPGAVLPLRSWRITAPRVISRLSRPNVVKLEFHLAEDLPPDDALDEPVFTSRTNLSARVPKLPFQISLKVLTLPDPPVGIDELRADAIPRQLYDLDHLFPLLGDAEVWEQTRDWVSQRHAYELRVKRQGARADGLVYGEADTRLAEWQAGDHWQSANIFQSQQLFGTSRLTPVGWQARAARLRLALRYLAAGDFATWQNALAEAPPGTTAAAHAYWLDLVQN